MDLLSRARISKIEQLSHEIIRSAEGIRGGEADGYLGLSEKEIKAYSFSKAASRMSDMAAGRVHLREGRDFGGLEGECSRALEKTCGQPFSPTSFFVPRDVTHGSRAMSTIPGSKGGDLVAPDVAGFVDSLQNASVCLSLGAQRIVDQSANVVYVKEKTGPTVSWQAGDGVSTSAADPAFAQLSGLPHTAIAIH